jgi:hypothetical protein
MAVDEWRELCRRLDALRMSRAMDIVILAHAQIRNFKNPVGEDYDRYGLRINEKAAGWLREWSDVTGFACFEEGASKEVADDSRARGYSTGRRLLRFTRSAVADAKTRLLLPSEMTLDPINGWARIAAAVCFGRTDTGADCLGHCERTRTLWIRVDRRGGQGEDGRGPCQGQSRRAYKLLELAYSATTNNHNHHNNNHRERERDT